MIFLTIGTQLPFDRLVRTLDALAPSLDRPIFGQIGKTSYRPRNFEYCEGLQPAAFDKTFQAASTVVSHAGIGTILTARKFRKPLIVFPRQAKHHEHRNDHQLATCNQLRAQPGVHVAVDEQQLKELLLRSSLEPPEEHVALRSRDLLVRRLRHQIDQFIMAGDPATSKSRREGAGCS